MNDFEFGCAWAVAQSLVNFGIPTLVLVVSGFAIWAIIFALVWMPLAVVASRSINRDLAEYWVSKQERK
jgi:uncharacterized membrane protein YciS (DUF1049 family)